MCGSAVAWGDSLDRDGWLTRVPDETVSIPRRLSLSEHHTPKVLINSDSKLSIRFYYIKNTHVPVTT